jgi:signal transduction histidine kinase
MTTLTRQLDDMHALTDRILKRARLAGDQHSGILFDFHSELPALIQTMHMMYPNKVLNIRRQLPDQMEPLMDREDMLELLGNLLDNACKWASQQVLISIARNDRLHIRIEDDGPGGQRESLDRLAARGVRLDESVSGYGFGLAIVADIVDDYGGRLSFHRSDKLGGFRVDVELPVKR